MNKFEAPGRLDIFNMLIGVLRAVSIALAAGWLVAILAGLGLARLQYAEVLRAFPPDRVDAEYNMRIEHELGQGPLLLLIQVGVMAGVLAWQVGLTAQRAPQPVQYGALSGIAIAIVQVAVAIALHVPWAFIVPLVAVLIGAGCYAGWSAHPDGLPTRIR